MSVETHAHHEHPDVVGSRNRLGVILLLVADIAFALSMVFVYFYLRGQNVNDMWLPAATADRPAIEPLSAGPGWTVTAIVALGLLAHMYGLKGARTQNQTQLKLGSLVALVVSVVAMVYQYNTIATAPFTFSDGAYVSCFYMFAIMNLVHILLTVFISLGNWNRARLGLYVENFWHVDIVRIWWIWMVVSSLLGAFSLSYP
ncbi:MAG: cytochrome c oxidase subunit 3 [Actinomycetes bacterium]|jgi:heme/copper-type cytochrome/quinol oxidase subunit 3